MRNPTFNILKALAIILVVIAHATAPTYIANLAYMVGVPAFFVLSGYFFKTEYLDNATQFVIRRGKRLYLPFLGFGILFLVLHNFFFDLSFLSENYGNAAGGVTHPYTWTETCQHLWSMAFNMSGYDPFLAGAFWFFRSLLLSNLAFFFLFKIARNIKWLSFSVLQVTSVGGIAIVLALWLAAMGLHITGVAQGGYRELMGIVLISIGFLLRKADNAPETAFWRNSLVMLSASSIIIALLVIFYPIAMSVKPNNSLSVVALSLAGAASFVWLRSIAQLILQLPDRFTTWIHFIGEKTLYIFVFHLLAFKVVSMIKVAAYSLPWEMVGGHPVVQHETGDAFWLLYALCGVGLPILPIWCWKKITEQRKFDPTNPKDWLRLIVRSFYLLYLGLISLGKSIGRGLVKLWNNIISSIKSIIEAASPKDE